MISQIQFRRFLLLFAPLNAAYLTAISCLTAFGGDGAQWYSAGLMIRTGMISQLYAQQRFWEFSDIHTGHAFFSLYPPQVGLAFTPLSVLSFTSAVWVVCILQILAVIYAVKPLSTAPDYVIPRNTVTLIFFSFLPLAYCLHLGQLSISLLAVLVLAYQQILVRNWLVSGIAISLLAAKPTIFVGFCIWALLRCRKSPALLTGLGLGLLTQAVLVVAFMGIQPILEYAWLLPDLGSMISDKYHFFSAHQHGFRGILNNWLPSGQGMITSIIQTLFTAIVSIVFLRQLFRLWRSSDGGSLRLEYSCVTIFSVAIAPHVLTYDLVLLLCPVVLLMNNSDHVCTAPLAFVVYIACQLTTVGLVTGASLIPAVLLYVLWKCPNLNSAQQLQICNG